jgi:hypothetical protein
VPAIRSGTVDEVVCSLLDLDSPTHPMQPLGELGGIIEDLIDPKLPPIVEPSP